MTTIEDQDSLSEHRCACDACTVLHNSCYVQYNFGSLDVTRYQHDAPFRLTERAAL